MYCDLNVRKKGQTQNDQLFLQLLTSCVEDNYEAVAINHHFKDVILLQKDVNPYKPIELEELSKRVQKSMTIQQFTMKPLQFKQYSRVTLDVSELKYLHQMNDQNKILQSYDVIAVKPKTDKVLLSLCNDFDYFDIVTFDCFDKLAFIPKRNIVNELINKGIYFELNYSDALQDQNRRRVFISNANIIIKATKGKNIIFSSDADNWMFHRSPYDLVALGATLGMKKDSAFQAVNKNPTAVIQRAKHRKAYKGTVSLSKAEDIEYFQQKQREKKANDEVDGPHNNLIKQLEKLRKKIKISKEVYQNFQPITLPFEVSNIAMESEVIQNKPQ